MGKNLTNFSEISLYQEEDSRVSALVFINNINKDDSKNFISSLVSAIDNSQTTIEVSGNYSGYTGLIITESEVMSVVSAVDNGANTVMTVTRDNDTVPLAHSSSAKVYSVQFMGETNSYNYEMKCDVSDSDLFGVNVETGNLKLLAEFLDWSNFSNSRVYDYKSGSPIFILEGINNQFIKTYQGYTSNKNPNAFEGYVDIEFRNELSKVYNSDVRKVKIYKDVYIGEILEDYYPEYTTEYVHMDNGEQDTYKIEFLDTSWFKKDSDFLKYLSRTTACRMRLAEDGVIKLFSEINPTAITPFSTIDKNLTNINLEGNDQLILNNMTGVFLDKSTWRDPNEFSGEYIKFNALKVYTTPIDIVEEKVSSPASIYGFTTQTFTGIDTTLVTFGDYVLLVDGTNEWWGVVSDINGSEIEVRFGIDKAQKWNQDGRLTGVVTTSSNYTLYYSKDELPIVWQYTRNINNEDRLSNLRQAVCPIVIDNTLATSSISFEDENTIVISGLDYTKIGNYAKLNDAVSVEYVLIAGTTWDGFDTTIYIEREKLNTTKITTPTTFSPIKYSNMIEISDSFKFNDFNEKIYSGFIDGSDDLLDTWYDKTTLYYNREFSQSLPIYLYSNTTEQSDTSDTDQKKISYTGYDNDKIEVLFERSKNPNFKFNVKVKNTNEINLSDIDEITPISVLGNQIEITETQYDATICGSVLSLKEVIDVNDDRYATYIRLKDEKFIILYKYIDSGSYYFVVDRIYPTELSGNNFDFIVYDNAINENVLLQELSVRGNPIMQIEQSINEKDEVSIEKYGLKPYDVTNNSLSLVNFQSYLDHMKNTYKGLSTSNTKFKVPFSSVCRLDLEVLDVVTIDDNLITGLSNQKMLIINKKVSNNEGVRNENYISITLGNYTADSNNITLSKSNRYNPYKIPTFNHRDHKKEEGEENKDSTSDSAKLIDGNVINYTDAQFGNVSLIEIPIKIFTAYVSSFDGVIDGLGTISLKNITSGVTQYNRILTAIGEEGFMKIRNEFIFYKCTATNDTLQILKRSAFGTSRAEIIVDDSIQFYAITQKTTTDGFYSRKVDIGDSETYFRFDPDTGAVFKGDFTIESGSGFGRIYYQPSTSIPVALNKGDTWFQTDTDNAYTAANAGADAIIAGKWENSATDNSIKLEYTGVKVGSTANSGNGGFEVDTSAEARIHNDVNDLYFKTGSNDSYIKMNSDGTYFSQQIGQGLQDSVDTNFKGFFLGDGNLENSNYLKYNQNGRLGSLQFEGKYFNKTAYVRDTIDLTGALDVDKPTIELSDTSIVDNPYFGLEVFEIILVEKDVTGDPEGTITLTTSTGVFNYIGHNLIDKQEIKLTATVMPSELNEDSRYYIEYIDADNFKLRAFEHVVGDSFYASSPTPSDIQIKRVSYSYDFTEIATDHFQKTTDYGVVNSYIIPNKDIETITSLYGSRETTIKAGEITITTDSWGIYLDNSIRISNIRFKNLGSYEILGTTKKAIFINSQDVHLSNIIFNSLNAIVYNNFKAQVSFDGIYLFSYSSSLPYIFYLLTNLTNSFFVIDTGLSGGYIFNRCRNANNLLFSSTSYVTGFRNVIVFQGCHNFTNIDTQDLAVYNYVDNGKNFSNCRFNILPYERMFYDSYTINNIWNYECIATGTANLAYFENCQAISNVETTSTVPTQTNWFKNCSYVNNVNSTTTASYVTGLTYDINNSWNTDLTNNTNFSEIKIGDVSGGNYFEVKTDGTVRLVGDATSWDDLRVPAISSKLGGSKNPDFVKVLDNGSGSQGVFTYAFSPTQEEEIYLAVQLPHSWKQGSEIEPHIHWIPKVNGGAGDKVRWGLEYSWSNVGSVYGNTTIIYGEDTHITETLVANKHYITDLGGIVATGKELSSMILCRVFRDATSANDDYSDDANMLEIDFHYQVDSLGSDTEYTKA